jgi:hypothetical protein
MLIYYDEFAAGQVDYDAPGVPGDGYAIRLIERGGSEAEAVGHCLYLDETVNQTLSTELMRARGVDEPLPYYVDAQGDLYVTT